MPPTIPDWRPFAPLVSKSLWLLRLVAFASMGKTPLSALALLPASVTLAAAQNYPWCSNFADGAGTNCGFSTEAQCKITAAGSGGYCDQNVQYRPLASPSLERRPLVKRHTARSPIRN